MWQSLLLVGLLATSPTGELIPEGNETGVEIVALYPNTVLEGNRGEFIVVHVPTRQQTDTWVFRDDGRQRAKPPPRTVNGTVAFSHDPDIAREYLDMPVHGLEGRLQLAVDGEAVSLEIDGDIVDTVGYDDRAPQAHLWIRGSADPWVALAATGFDVVEDRAGVQSFVLPDSPHAVATAMAGANERLYLGGYELGPGPVLEALLDAHDRGVDVAVHAEGTPVGGITEPYGAALDALSDAGIQVTVHRGPYTRYGFHHPKYVVADDSLLVTTENFKPAGTGGAASRGWAVVVESSDLADAAAAVFDADTAWRDAQTWQTVRDDIARHEDEPDEGTYPEIHPPAHHEDIEAALLLAPDNAEPAMLELIEGATESIHIKQVRIADIDFPLLAATIDRAYQGVSVRILLSDRWYVQTENRALAEELNRLADTHELDLEVALVDDTATFDRIHAKGLIVDESVAVVGSINWNNHSLRQNREMALALADPTVAGYYLEVFTADWPADASDGWQVPLTLVLAALAAAALVAEHARRMRMEGIEAQADEAYTE